MEKITYLPNGQWNLEKAKPAAHESYIYNLRSGDANRSYSGKDLLANQDKVVSDYKQKIPHAIKTMPNDTGSPEEHVLMHRGEDSRATASNAKKPQDFNRYKADDSHIHFSDDSVNTPNYSEAMQYTDKANPKVHSFWVPKSKLHAEGDSHQKHILDKDHTSIHDIVSDLDPEYLKRLTDVSPEDIAGNEDAENELRESMARDFSGQHSVNDQWHVALQPGKYKLASKDELAHHHKGLSKLSGS